MRDDSPPDIPGAAGALARAAHRFRKATQVLPPLGVGLGGGLGLGCGLGWPLRQAYGPPRAVCGPMIGVGVGAGYGQGLGRRFGRDTRPQGLRNWFSDIEKLLDRATIRVLAPFRRLRRGKGGDGDEDNATTTGSADAAARGSSVARKR